MLALFFVGVLGSSSCPDKRSYWVQPQEEYPAGWLTANAYCVPTAAGNLITHLRATRGEQPYNYNYELDQLVSGVYELTTEGDQVLNGGKVSDALYLGGSIHTDSTKNMGHFMQTDSATGTTVANGRSGLKQYLDTTNALPDYEVVAIDRPDAEYDAQFLAGKNPPYLLHISPACIHGGMWQIQDEVVLPENLKEVPEFERSPLAESTLGHTIVVYETVGTTDSTLTVGGASGLRASRKTTNERGCDHVLAVAFDSEKCVVGITQLNPTESSDFPPWAIAVIVVGILVIGVVSYVWCRRSTTSEGLMMDWT